MMNLQDGYSIDDTFESFWNNWYSRIFSYTSSFASFTYEDREDVTQEIILKLCEEISKVFEISSHNYGDFF